ncbi:DNA alkylation repair protein [Pseudodesulfovibrio sp.]|nr:DNA alkylation repair protein [Pseudodesulfovibrio sp.]
MKRSSGSSGFLKKMAYYFFHNCNLPNLFNIYIYHYWLSFSKFSNTPRMRHLIDQIQRELRANADPQHRDQLVWFFKEQPVDPIGVRSKEMNILVARFWREIKAWDKEQIWTLCDALWETIILENGHLACKFAFRVDKRLDSVDFDIFSGWLHNHIYNWAHCDDLCAKALGEILVRYPTTIDETANWHASPNRWVRRGLAVSMLPSLKKNMHIDHTLDVADRLLLDEDDLVQKGYGWMLKVASQTCPDTVYQFVLDRRDRMPRTALRYAIEKLPADMRKEAMKKV